MNNSYNKVSFSFLLSLICSEALSAENILSHSFLDKMESAAWVYPIREIGEDGSIIVKVSEDPSAIPFFYPKLVPVFDFMDHGKTKFYTLEQLSVNPKLGPRPVFRKIENNHFDEPVDVKQDKKVLSLEARLRELEQKLLDKETQAARRPGDDELRAFILEGNEHLSPEQRLAYLSRVVTEAKQNSPAPQKSSLVEINSHDLEPPFSPSVSNPQKLSDFSTPVSSSPNDGDLIYSPGLHTPDVTKSVLRFKASVPTSQGKARPAQASEFYLTTQNLQDLLSDLNLDRALAGEVKSVAELWANAEKDSSSNPEVALGVKSILLQAKVGKARTDPFGKAELNDVSPDDKYYLIGIDKDDQTGVVTIWSKHVEVTPGENMVELTTNDVIYQD